MNIARLTACLAAASTTFLFAQSARTPVRVEQKGRDFSVHELTVKRGDAIEFCNADDVTHNVFSRAENNAFNRTQAPGGSSVVEFKQAGVVEVRCAIHPRMKLLVTVTE